MFPLARAHPHRPDRSPTTSRQPGTGRAFPHRAARRPLQPDRRTSILRPSNGFYVRPGARGSRVRSTPASARPHPGTPIPLRGSAVPRWGLRDCDGGPWPLQGSPVGAGRRSRLAPPKAGQQIPRPRLRPVFAPPAPPASPAPAPGCASSGPITHLLGPTERVAVPAPEQPGPRGRGWVGGA